ncbi:muscleblind-like protein 1 isoform X9 [Uranotaenia lowii]|uniref:muscleblind-like protein 1 isoform X9 n=1 Tax=Uranotaenia lowii TaxID=190385 RepID=UPI0024785FCC|nr:muscleblind-like protein 1 isoform X9 [Uranotaenia lowii]
MDEKTLVCQKVVKQQSSDLGRCNREKPPCKYFHPPQHLKDQLLINGRNHLALKNAIMQQMGISPGQPVLPGQVPTVNGTTAIATNGIPQGATAAALGFTIAWGAHHPPYTTYVVNGAANGCIPTPAILNGATTTTAPSCLTTYNTNNNSSIISSCNTSCHTTTSTSSPPLQHHHNNNYISTNNNNNSPPATCKAATNPYLTGMPASTYSPYFPPGHLMPTLLGPADPSAVSAQLGPVVQQAVVPATQQKIPRSDRLETAPVSAAAAVAAAAAAAAATMGTLQPPPPPPSAAAAAAAAHAAAAAAAAAGVVTSSSSCSVNPLSISQHQQASLEAGKKRAADNDMIQMMDMKTMGSFYYENFAFPGMVPYKRTAADKSGIPVYQPGATTYQQLMQLQQPFVPVSSAPSFPLNAPYVIYTDANGQSVFLVPPLQLLDTLPVCQDFNRSMCTRPTCRFVHLMECDKVEVCDQRVAVCRDHAKGMCKRKQCKYYHIPIELPPANVMAATAKLAE